MGFFCVTRHGIDNVILIPGPNVINYGLFTVIYGTQFSREEFTGKSTDIYNLYVLKKSVKTSINVDYIGP
jgi:hypothetical protein